MTSRIFLLFLFAPAAAGHTQEAKLGRLTAANPDLKLGNREFTDTTLLKEIAKEGFFTALQR